MTIEYTVKPGAYERHQKRKHCNPLFPDGDSITAETVKAAQDRDSTAYDNFMTNFRQMVQDIVSLDSKAESQDILDLKSRLDQAFEACAPLPGDLTPIREAIQKLMTPMMQAVQAGAGNDATALSKLSEEDTARALHYTLLENPLIADLLSEDSPIGADELAATLLSEDASLVHQAMQLFTPEQRAVLLTDATALLQNLEKFGRSTAFAAEQMDVIKAAAGN